MESASHSDLPAIPGYDISQQIGYGGMGIVNKAVRHKDRRWVALKMINSRRPDLKERFRREVNLVARLRHPNIVELYETGSHDGWPYFTMEYVGGATWRLTGGATSATSGRPLPWSSAWRGPSTTPTSRGSSTGT
jgi:serine/threonine protein kinase